MRNIRGFWRALVVLAAALHPLSAAEVTVANLAELAEYAARSDNEVTLRPGVYSLTELLPPASIAERRKREEFAFLVFSGSGNVFHLDGVILEVDTALRAALKPPIHTDEFVVAGNRNTLIGLTIKNLGDGASHGGAVLGLTGNGTTLRDCTLHVCGSRPYGYGDLFGKGGYKKSGIHITGRELRLLNCKVFTKALGHGIYFQEDAGEVLLEDCYVEGVMRSTDEMLRETKGFAVERAFVPERKNHAGELKILPGYQKALSEDGFRTYARNDKLTFKNCSVKNMRGGFELREAPQVRLENCTTRGTERGYWLGKGAVVVNCRGDAQYGPLLFVEGDDADIELELLPAESPARVHAIATLFGAGHKLKLSAAKGAVFGDLPPLLLGYGTPSAGDGMTPIPERPLRNLTLRNATPTPIVIGDKARDCKIATRGPVDINTGQNIEVERLTAD